MLSSFSFFCKQTRIKNGFSIRAFLPLFLFESVAAAAAGGAAAGIAAAALFGFFACQGCCDDVEYGIYEVIEILFRNVQIRCQLIGSDCFALCLHLFIEGSLLLYGNAACIHLCFKIIMQLCVFLYQLCNFGVAFVCSLCRYQRLHLRGFLQFLTQCSCHFKNRCHNASPYILSPIK